MTQLAVASTSRLLGTLQALFLFVGGLVGASFAVGAWGSVAAAVGVVDGTTGYQLSRTVFQFAGFVAPALLFVAAAGDRSLLPFGPPDRRQIALVAVGVVCLYVLQYGLLELFGFFGVSPVQNRAIDPASHAPAYFLWMMLLSVLVVGPAEELLFRGAIQGLLTRSWGPWPGILGASALFGSLHYSVGSGPTIGVLAYVAIAFLLGVVLGALYERTENLVIPTLTHGGFNAVAFGLQYLTVTG
jgi:membrane protease YdiL (CAAX protease family)